MKVNQVKYGTFYCPYKGYTMKKPLILQKAWTKANSGMWLFKFEASPISIHLKGVSREMSFLDSLKLEQYKKLPTFDIVTCTRLRK